MKRMNFRRRDRRREDHLNHEAWAIPYGDLVTLLLAFFVVMYSTSSANEGKMRQLSEALSAAFRGAPRTLDPDQVGNLQAGVAVGKIVPNTQFAAAGSEDPTAGPRGGDPLVAGGVLNHVADDVQSAMSDLIASKKIAVRRVGSVIEVEIGSDMLFPSGSATLSSPATDVITRLAAALAPYPNPVRVEGHTDSQPINTTAFPSNWELSAARAASVVHVFDTGGVAPTRLSVVGLSQYRPLQPNTTPEGRSANRRVLITVLAVDPPAAPPNTVTSKGKP